ncbi:MAG: hypothetical protein C0501_09340 [Isosphaera sp.]|nr:hypothetical protein [Isosphaera sp.]
MHGSARRHLVPVALLLAAAPGCTRKFFRERADADVAGVITQKNQFPDWVVKNWYVYPHPDARFAHPYNPDRPPYPVDDAAARLLSPNPQHPTKKTGVGRYDGEGYLRLLEQWDADNRARAAAARAAPPGAAPAWSAVAGPAVTESRGPDLAPAVALEPAPPAALPDPAPAAPAQDPPPEKLPNAPRPLPPDPAVNPEALPYGGALGDESLRALTSNQGGFRLALDQAVELGLLNSREFQDRREDLYLVALPVTLERYNFAAQAFFTEQVTRDFLGSERGGGRLWRFDTTAGFSKNFATGASLLVRLANQVVIDLGSGRPDVAFSNLSLSFLQPLLRGGGFAVNLESLTQAERNMLYGMRSYARFRKLFYVSIAAGGEVTNNPYGLQGLSQNLGRGIGGNLTAPTVGFLPLLQLDAIVDNQRRNVAELDLLLRRARAFQEGGLIAPLQVNQVEVQLLNSRANLLGQGATGGITGPGIRGYLDALDNFKLQVGLPLTVGLDPDDGPLRPVREQLSRFEDVSTDVRDLELAASRYSPADPPAETRARFRKLLAGSALVKGTAFARGIDSRLDALAGLANNALLAREADLLRERTALRAAREKRQDAGQPEPPDEARRLAAVESDIDLVGLERALRAFEARPWEGAGAADRGRVQAGAFRDAFNAFFQVALEARNERLADARTRWPRLPGAPVDGVDLLAVDLDEAYTAGIRAALTARLDLMNARGQVVDAYRQIAVQANSLQGALDVGYDYDVTTPAGGNQPFAFSSDRARNRLTFRGELPLVRRAERNNYRAALIAYQRQRRTLMAFEDNIANDVRNDIRELRALAELYAIQQRAVELAYSQLDNARETLFAPLAAGAVIDPGAAAALTDQVLRAQNNLLQAQNTLFNIWVNYGIARMTLYLDLELLQLDDRGVWCDEQGSRPDDPPRPDPAPGRLPAPARLEPVGRD